MPSLRALPASTAHVARRGLRAAWRVLVEIGHNSLALLGLAALGVLIFFHNESSLRHEVERQMLDWLNLRHAPAEQAGETIDVLSDIAEPQAIGRAAASPLKALSRQQVAVAQWISRRYRVAPEPVARLVQEAWSISRKAQIEPTLILALIAIESGFNPFAQSPVGAQGLMQVMTQVHDDKYRAFGGTLAAFDPVTNLRVGVQVLLECIQRAGGSLEVGLKYYVGAANLPDDGGYAERVLVESGHLKAVASGQNVPVTVPITRSAAMTAPAPAGKPAVSTGVALVDSLVAKVLPVPTPATAAAVPTPASQAPIATPAPAPLLAMPNLPPSTPDKLGATNPGGATAATPSTNATHGAAAPAVSTGAVSTAPAGLVGPAVTAPAATGAATPAAAQASGHPSPGTSPAPASAKPAATIGGVVPAGLAGQPAMAPAADGEGRAAPPSKAAAAPVSTSTLALAESAVR